MERDTMLRREEEAWRRFRRRHRGRAGRPAGAEGVVPGWSPHDLLWHCAYWVDFTGGVLEKVRAGDADPEGGAASRRTTSWPRAAARAGTSRWRAPTQAESGRARRCPRSTTRSRSWRRSGSARTPSSTTTSTRSRSACSTCSAPVTRSTRTPPRSRTARSGPILRTRTPRRRP